MVNKLSLSFYKNLGIAWAIEDKNTNKVIGNIGLYFIVNEKEKAGIGYNICKKYQNKGIATWALNKCIGVAFTEFNIKKIEATCKSINIASERVMQKCGMILEDIKEKSSIKDGFIYDVKVYSINKSN